MHMLKLATKRNQAKIGVRDNPLKNNISANGQMNMITSYIFIIIIFFFSLSCLNGVNLYDVTLRRCFIGSLMSPEQTPRLPHAN